MNSEIMKHVRVVRQHADDKTGEMVCELICHDGYIAQGRVPYADHMCGAGATVLECAQADLARHLAQQPTSEDYERGKKDGWEACETCHGIVDGKLPRTLPGPSAYSDYLAFRHAVNALLHQIDIGDFVDSHGHSAKMLKPVHDLHRLLTPV